MLPETDLVNQGLVLVQTVSRKLARRLGGRVPLDDLTGIGNLALVDVARSYDPARASFATYAIARLRWAILDGVRRESHTRSMMSRAMALLASERLAAAQAGEPEPAGPTTLEEDQQALASFLQGQAAALALGLVTSPLAPEHAATPEEEVQRAELAHVVKGVIGGLPDRERALMERHYYGGEEFEAIAGDLGISKSWASRLHERAIVALQGAMVPPEPAEEEAEL
jgi:RNA polymerase sigma factor FliA